MTQSPLLEFESVSFAVDPGEDEQTNPGVFGKALATWLSAPLQAGGVVARLLGKDRSAEDVASLYGAVRQVLSASPLIGGLRERPSA
jgi:hypothetical protein